MLSDGSIEVAYSSGEAEGSIQVCTIPQDGRIVCRHLEGIWGPRFVRLGPQEAVSGLRPAETGPQEAPRFDVALAIPGPKGVDGSEFRTTVLKGGNGPFSVFRLGEGRVFLVRGKSVVGLDEEGREIQRLEVKTTEGSWVADPHLLDGGDSRLVVAVSRSAKGAKISVWNLDDGGAGRDVSDQTVPRIGDLQVVSVDGRIYCFWSERTGKTHRLMMDVSQDQGRTWRKDKILVQAVREITYQAQGGNGKIRLIWQVGRRFDQPFGQNLNTGEVGSEGLMSQQRILECSEECSIVDFSLGSADANGQLLAVSVQQSGRSHVEAFWTNGSDNQWQKIRVRDMSEAGTINCLQVLGRGHRFVLMYRFQRAIRSFLQPFVPGQICYSIIDI